MFIIKIIDWWENKKILYFCSVFIENKINMIEQIITQKTKEIIEQLYSEDVNPSMINIQKTRSEISGDFTIVVFPFLRFSKKSPEETANEIGEKLKTSTDIISSFNVIKGFLNIEIANSFWLNFVKDNFDKVDFGYKKVDANSNPVVIEYSSPNTNKPLHLGHIRNNLLGYSIAKIVEASGQKVEKVNLVNDRGIHICKSMLAWQKWGSGETPESTKMKGDHLIGKYYVLFDKEYKKDIKNLVDNGMEEDEAKKQSPLLLEAREMLKKWEDRDEEVMKLWKTMNDWVYAGFDVTYKRMGVSFDKIYHESETYLLGKAIVEKGLDSGVLFKKEDGSVWADLTDEGLDEKLLLRPDGTSVYMTQDLGTAEQRYADYSPKEMVYVVGNEQIYHFDVLKLILKKLGYDWSERITHLSYGMVELPEGKMKSREGTVVDADDLMEDMTTTAATVTKELGKIEGLSEEEAKELFETIGLGALKYFILKVDPKKTMTFNPKESIDFNGNTGPFIQYTHARIKSVLRKAGERTFNDDILDIDIHSREKVLMKRLFSFPDVIRMGAEGLSPAQIANYTYELVREFNQFYHDVSILKEEDEKLVQFRLMLANFTGNVIRNGMKLLGVNVPDRM